MLLVLESLLNINENKKMFLFFCFLSLSFIGVTIVDSIIFSVSKKAEQELNVNGENKLTIEFYEPVERDVLTKALSKHSVEMSFSKRMIINASISPFSEQSDAVTGTDINGLGHDSLYPGKMFKGNVVILSGKIKPLVSNIFISGVPFEVVGIKKDVSTNFLDSLGINLNYSKSSYYVPIETLRKMSLSTTVTGVSITLGDNVTQDKVDMVKSLLEAANINKYYIYSPVDAKETVNRVISRFRLLTNTIYLVLNISSVAVIITICRRNFQLRATEFALKVIHGVNVKNIIYVVIIETAFVTLSGVIISMFFAFLCLKILSGMLAVDLELRLIMLMLSFVLLIITCILSNVIFGSSFFNKEPITIIKGRTI